MAANDPKIKMTIRPPKELYEMLRDYCHVARSSHNAVVIRALRLYLTDKQLQAYQKRKKSKAKD